MSRGRALLLVALLVAALPVLDAAAQNSRETERRLERVRKELRDVAAERRRLEGQRGEAARDLRAADEQVSTSARALRDTRIKLAEEQIALEKLQARRVELESTVETRREELAALVRAAYTVGDEAALKLMLAQDRVADAGRLLTYHRYLQQQRSTRISELRAEMAELDGIEAAIQDRRAGLEAAQVEQRAQLAKVESDRSQRAEAVKGIESRFSDRSAREKALGRDARSLERVLTQLREAARRAEAERRAAAAAAREREAREAREATAAGRPRPPPRPPTQVARTTAPQVGGLGWPVSGSLLTAYGGKLPDGRSSTGILIGAPAGTAVKAVADGTVVFAEWMTGYGMLLIVDHGNGYMSLYAHNDGLLKSVGNAVRRGDTVSSVGSSGGQGRSGLYFELRQNGTPVNPTTWLQRR
ncbi:murein hydrolase activator EnvC family protein [Luteimonas fraxinea]|uniref:Peptidoglycan DD-metalloendopeptidase family protein n=1 Tax=Luteimonas fraxinea TaxID=2901869 RepID=A0ABS8UEJ9_9GAMM|nr:peptidoglycan DD-metalloendopeptidase family protein [Luteimonas fraxinea]MCD9097659.1 peptidoglycan DD-metalloendopeptidase family protein [Luteimonas fraxinea]